MTKAIIVVVDKKIPITPVLKSGSAYASGELLFPSIAIPNAVREDGGAAILQNFEVYDSDAQGAAFTLLFSASSINYGSAGSPISASKALIKKTDDFVSIATSDYIAVGASSKLGEVKNIGISLNADSACSCIWVAGMNGTGTPTWTTASGLTFKFSFLR